MEVVSRSIPTYFPENEDASDRSNKPDLHCLATDAMQQEWNQDILYAFPPFLLIQRVLCKIEKEKVSTVILITPEW